MKRAKLSEKAGLKVALGDACVWLDRLFAEVEELKDLQMPPRIGRQISRWRKLAGKYAL